MTEAPAYRQLMTELEASLAHGPKTTRQLKDEFCPRWPEWQVMNCLTYIAAIKVPGRKGFDPALVYAAGDPNAPKPEVDKWLLDLYAKAGVDQLMSAAIIDANEQGPGHSKVALKQAYQRLGLTATKRRGHWWRTKGGTPVTPNAVERSKTVRSGQVYLDDNKAACLRVLKAIAEAADEGAPVVGVIGLDGIVGPTPRLDREARSTMLVKCLDALSMLGYVGMSYVEADDDNALTVTGTGHDLLAAWAS